MGGFASHELQHTILSRFRMQNTILSNYVEHVHRSKSIVDENIGTKHDVTLLVPRGSSCLMQPIIFLTKAPEAFWFVENNKGDNKGLFFSSNWVAKQFIREEEKYMDDNIE